MSVYTATGKPSSGASIGVPATSLQLALSRHSFCTYTLAAGLVLMVGIFFNANVVHQIVDYRGSIMTTSSIHAVSNTM
jgi:hypothetical protein